MQNKDSISNTLQVAIVLCVACSLLVSLTAIGLRSTQKNNVALDKKKNILQVAGFSATAVRKMDSAKIETYFDGQDKIIEIEDVIVNLEAGRIASESELKEIFAEATADGIKDFDQEKIAKSTKEQLAKKIPVGLIGLKEHENFSHVYIVKNKKKNIVSRYIFPVKGKGLWSTLFGFIAVDSSFQKIEGLTFFKHGETPGLGGEVDNPKWKKLWEGRMIYTGAGELAKAYVVKGTTPPDNRNAVDGLSGATITSKGVSSLVRFWLSDEGFGRYMNNVLENSSHSKSDG